MPVSSKHILHQGPVLGALARGVYAALRGPTATSVSAPGPWFEQVVPPRPKELIRDYVRHVGGERSAYSHFVPPHLFPQWTFPLQAKALEGVPYPMQRVLNGGSRVEVSGPLPQGETLYCRTRLESIDDNGRRAVLRFVAFTGTQAEPELLRADLYAIVPLKRGPKGERKEKPRVARDAREIAYWRIGAGAGLDFAKLTGDFNPVHWVRAYARASGFRNCILHGFSTMARAYEGVARGVFAGDPHRIRVFDCRFTRPLVLPAKVGLFVRRGSAASDVYVGAAAGGPAYLQGTFEEHA